MGALSRIGEAGQLAARPRPIRLKPARIEAHRPFAAIASAATAMRSSTPSMRAAPTPSSPPFWRLRRNGWFCKVGSSRRPTRSTRFASEGAGFKPFSLTTIPSRGLAETPKLSGRRLRKRRHRRKGAASARARGLRTRRNRLAGRRNRHQLLALLPEPSRRGRIEGGAHRGLLAPPHEVLTRHGPEGRFRCGPDLRSGALLLADQERPRDPREDAEQTGALHREAAGDRSGVHRVRRHPRTLQPPRQLEREEKIHQLRVAVLPDSQVAALHL